MREEVEHPQHQQQQLPQPHEATTPELPDGLLAGEAGDLPYQSFQANDQQLRAQFHGELMRVREVFRYLEPWESNIRPTITSKQPDGSDNPTLASDPANDWTPVGCEDTALAAFAQLGALRLNAQRCLISLVSKDQEIVLAESTKTLSLQSDLVHTQDDALWLGTTSFPRAEGMGCVGLRQWKKTVETRELPQDEDEHYYTDGISKHWHVISDMRQHPEFHQSMFVRRAKGLRFYAAVPIRTPSGSVIGSYAVLDDKPRFGVSAREMEFLEDIADTVMGHLEAKRAMMQRQRGDRLVKGLALFNGGKTSLREWWLANYSRQQRGEGQRRRRRSSSEDELREERADDEFGQTYRAEDLDPRGRLISNPSSPDRQADQARQHSHRGGDASARLNSESSAPTTSGTNSGSSSAASKSRASDLDTPSTNTSANSSTARRPSSTDAGPVRKPEAIAADTIASAQAPHRKSEAFDLPREIEGVFARASNLVREALNTEGVLFIDTDFPRSQKQRRGRYKKGNGPHQHVPPEREHSLSSTTATESEGELRQGGAPSTPQSTTSDPFNHSTGPCNILGFSTKIKSSLRGFRPSQKQSSMPKELMNRLLRRYPHGKIFNYHNGRSLSSSSAGEGSGSAREVELPTSGAIPKAKTKSKEAQDANALAELVSEPRSVAFLPLWDDRRDRWRAGILVWNVAPNRFLDLEEDVTYLAAFGNSLMSELGRLEIIAADQAKATFISSVSHELRSPLHGVLAGVEFLQESKLDTYQQEMTTTISMAGKTLLDTINNILDFTKINSFTDSQRTDRKNRDLARHSSFKSTDVGEVGVTRDVDLAALTENVVNTLVTANQFRASVTKKSLQSTRRSSSASSLSRTDTDVNEPMDPIVVVLDLAKRPTWRLNTSPGSWTRIITNLVGNAFKYTKAGTISISLKTGRVGKDGRAEVQLLVEDTGQGISEDFQKHHLWTPFMQENTHAIGTGLGLSIVKQVVEDIGGQIMVESEVGRGTKIKVSLIAELIKHEVSSEMSDYDTEALKRTKLAFLPSSGRSEPARRDRHVRSVVARTCRDWLDCSVEELDGSPEESSADVCFMVESDYEQWSQARSMKRDVTTGGGTDQGRRSGPPIIILSSLADPGAHNQNIQTSDNLRFVNQPFGPRKLARAIKAVLSAKSGPQRRQSPPARPATHMREIKEEDNVITSNSSASSTAPSTPGRRHSNGTIPPSVEDMSTPTEDHDTPSSTSMTGRILLVEDNAVNMKLLIAAMRKLQRPFVTAENGLEAVQQYASSPSTFALILMDMSMPIMDGFTATETIRVLEEKNKWKRCMIIALTGVASAEARQRAFTSGVDTFLTKPASMQKLKAIVEELDE